MCYNHTQQKYSTLNIYSNDINPELEPVAILNVHTFQHVNRNYELIDVYNVEQYFSQNLSNEDEYMHIFKVVICLIMFYYTINQLYKKIFGE